MSEVLYGLVGLVKALRKPGRVRLGLSVLIPRGLPAMLSPGTKLASVMGGSAVAILKITGCELTGTRALGRARGQPYRRWQFLP